jgi:hypothetical protein
MTVPADWIGFAEMIGGASGVRGPAGMPPFPFWSSMAGTAPKSIVLKI